MFINNIYRLRKSIGLFTFDRYSHFDDHQDMIEVCTQTLKSVCRENQKVISSYLTCIDMNIIVNFFVCILTI